MIAWLARRRWQLAALAIAAVVVIAAKQYYRGASAGELTWILAPTAALVSLCTGGSFVYEAGVGWVDLGAMYVIEPGCAGVNFAIAAFFALTLGWLGRMTSGRALIGWLTAAMSIAYGATLIINTLRLTLAIALHTKAIDLGGLPAADVHRAEGILVYLGGLCALYALARMIAAKGQHHAVAE